MSKNLRGLSARRGITGGLYERTVAAAKTGDGRRDEQLLEVSRGFMTGKAAVLGVRSFYDFLTTEHSGKKVFVCDGTACLVSGKTEEMKKNLKTEYSDHEIGTVSCLGHCHSNDAYLKDGEVHTICGDETVRPLRAESDIDDPPLLRPAADPQRYFMLAGQYAINTEPVIREIEKSGLRGRGGAGFPFHVKVRSSRDAIADQKYIVCNADEGDPGAFSDKWLLEERPYAVLFGMLMTGLVTGADTGVIYIRGEYPLAVRRTREAVRKLEQAGITGDHQRDAMFRFRFIVTEGSGAYICGEETSLLNSLEGLRPEVRTRPPFPAVYGLFGKPTVLSNVETYANIHYILEKGGEAYASLGTVKSPGTKLVSLDGAFNRPGLLEVRMGTPLRAVISEMGGGTRYSVKAFQIGGPLGGLVPASKVDDLTLDFESFASQGFLLGHAGIVSIPQAFPLIRFIEYLFEFTMKESCGKCFPCRLGSVRGYELIAAAADKRKKSDRKLFEDLLETMQLGSLCALGGGLPLPVKNALHYFRDELEEYFTD